MTSSILGLGSPVKIDVDSLTDEDKKVVDFALVQLQASIRRNLHCSFTVESNHGSTSLYPTIFYLSSNVTFIIAGR